MHPICMQTPRRLRSVVRARVFGLYPPTYQANTHSLTRCPRKLATCFFRVCTPFAQLHTPTCNSTHGWVQRVTHTHTHTQRQTFMQERAQWLDRLHRCWRVGVRACMCQPAAPACVSLRNTMWNTLALDGSLSLSRPRGKFGSCFKPG